MELKKKLRDAVGYDDYDDYDDEFEYDDDEFEDEEDRGGLFGGLFKNKKKSKNVEEDDYDDLSSDEGGVKKVKSVGKIVAFKPIDYTNAAQIGNAIKEGKVVTINTVELDRTTKLRLLDFVQGAVYMQEARLEVIYQDEVFMVVPKNMEFSHEGREEAAAGAEL